MAFYGKAKVCKDHIEKKIFYLKSVLNFMKRIVVTTTHLLKKQIQFLKPPRVNLRPKPWFS